MNGQDLSGVIFSLNYYKFLFVKINDLTKKCDEDDHQLDKLTREKVSYKDRVVESSI